MENILEVGRGGELIVPPGVMAEMGWVPGDRILLRRAEDGLSLHPMPMSAQEGGLALSQTIAGLQGETVTERDTGEVHRVGERKA